MRRIKKILLTAVVALLVAFTSVFLASCQTNTVTYVFNTNGGTEVSSVEVEIGSEYDLPVPEREGYEFDGWYLTENFSGEPVTSVVAESDVTYYAKWSQLYAINLELNGGSLSETTLYLKEGANVYDFMQNYVPTKSGLVFGAWFDGNVELSKNTRMTSAGITLSAKYKVGYTVELWLQELGKDTYAKDAKTVEGYAYVGEEFTSEQTLTGFTEVANQNAVTRKVLSEKASENVFRHYFSRDVYSVTFRPNYPDGSTGENEVVSVEYGMEVAVPSDYAFEGYCLIGWSTSANGEVVYKANYIENALYNKDGNGKTEDVTFVPERNTTLYAVWMKGYTDMFGGGDYIFVLDDASKVAYIMRGDVFFQGDYDQKDRDFYFNLGSDSYILEGRLNEDGTFIYYDSSRAEKVYTLLKDGVLEEKTQIYFDAYDGITYVTVQPGSYTDNNGFDIFVQNMQQTSEGTYYIDENGSYVATFTKGLLSGQTIVFIVGTVNGTPAFQIRNEEEVALGTLIQMALYNGSLVSYKIYDITLNGFGIATYNSGSAYEYYYYTLDQETQTLTLIDIEDNTVFLVARLTEEMNVKGYVIYDKAFDLKIEDASGSELTLDGGYKATYKAGGKTVTGYYQTQSSVFGGTIVTILAEDGEHVVLIKKTTTEVPVEGGTTEKVTTYSLEEKRPGYAEYYYQNSESTWYAPLLVLNETEEGKATLYGYVTATQTYEKVSYGTYEYSSATGLYLYTAEEYFEAEVSTNPWDITTIKAFVFNLGINAKSYNVSYWYSATTEEGTTEYVEEYTSNEDATLILVSGFAVYSAKGVVVTGAYSTKDGLTTIYSTDGYVYLELNEEEKTFITLEHKPYTAYLLNENGSRNQNEYIKFDGKGGATYTIVSTNENGEKITENYVGSIKTEQQSVAFGVYEVCTFTANEGDMTFKFIRLVTSSATYVAMYNDAYNGEYESEDGILTLDGFGYMASYVASNGDVYEGLYFITAEDVIALLHSDDSYLYFDILDNKEFSVRGTEYGTYILIDNQLWSDYYYEFDGYGKLSVYKIENEERVYVDQNGAYTQSGTTFTLEYVDNNKKISCEGELGSYEYYGYLLNAFYVSHKEVVQTFVNKKDCSVLILDDLGNATKYTKNGAKEYGTYVLITESLLYYVNEAATDACIYEYSVKEGTATPTKFTPRGYYTKDLESLIFQEYGFAIFNGTERLYYNEVKGEVVLYKYDPTAEGANKYGYVADYSFGRLENEEVYEGKTYYRNGGFGLTFQRDEEGKDNYKVSVSSEKYPLETLIFQPSGDSEFFVKGQVTVNGKNFTCYVVRSVDDEGNAETYVTIASNVGYLRFDVEFSYLGSSGSTYKVVGMSHVIETLSYTYMDTYYMYMYIDMLLGTNYSGSYTNNIGQLSIITEYDEEGETVNTYISSTFGAGSGLYLDDALISLEKVSYETTSDGFYKIKLNDAEGYTYNLYIYVQYHDIFDYYGFYYCLTREETLVADNGYTVTVERVIVSDWTSTGDFYSIQLAKDETVMKADVIWISASGSEVYYVVRTKDDEGKITATTYYVIGLIEKSSGSVDEEKDAVPVYESVTVSVETVTTVYTADGTSYVDISEKDGVVFLSVKGTLSIASSSVYDEATGTYTVKTSAGTTYTVKVEGETVVITEVVDTESSEE